jgi:hypothetical protein
MPLIPNRTFLQDLQKYRVWIEDTDKNSIYFNISEFPDVFTSGKNAFLIDGTKWLVNSTQLLIEILDVNGNPIYTRPIKNYLEGLSRIVSVEVYEDTPPGPATLIILGQVARDINGVVPPDEFIGVYNVRWSRSIIIDPTRLPNTRIRTYTKPTIQVNERLAPYKTAVADLVEYTGGGSLLAYPIIVPQREKSVYYAVQLQDTTNEFKSSAIGNGIVQFNYNAQSFTGSVVDVLNKSTAIISSSLNLTNSFDPIITNDYKISYTGSSVFAITNYTRSYVDVEYQNLQTFAGQIYRSKLYVRSVDEFDNSVYTLIDDSEITPKDLLLSRHASNELVSAGKTTNQHIVDRHWTFGSFLDTTSNYTGSSLP